MRITIALALLLAATPLAAQDMGDAGPWLQVVGSATVTTPPDLANLDYWVVGEGDTPDEATTALAAKHEAIRDALAGLLGQQTRLTTGEVIVVETRSPDCDGGGRGRPRLSEGVCAVTGYEATIQGDVRTSAIDQAGTAVGLAARLGARDARLRGFELADPGAAQTRAAAAAIADARAKAQALAEGGGVRLGKLIALTDQTSGGGIITVTATRTSAAAPPPPPPPPVEIAISPRPIETQARVHARFSIDP